MNEHWEQVRDHPNYSVSSLGRVRNDESGTPIKPTVNQRGIAQVKLGYGDNTFTNRGLAYLVANTFLPAPKRATDNTPINLNGDRTDCRAENLAWRPRWFAYKYHAQFKRHCQFRVHDTMENLSTGERFANSWDVALYYGLIEADLVVATMNRTYVYPTYDQFAIVG